MNHEPPLATQPNGSGLTPDELRGLARLGAMVNQFEAAMGSGMGEAAAAGVRRAGDLYEHYDLPKLLDDVLATLKVARESGLLALVRDNADFIVQSITLLKPLFARMFEPGNEVAWAHWKQHVATADRVLTQIRQVSEFYDQHLTGEMTEKIVALTALVQETDADDTLADALRALAHLRRNGTLQRMVDLSDHAAGLAETVDTGALIGSLVQKTDQAALTDLLARAHNIVPALQILSVAVKAVEDARRQPDTRKAGGLGGLIALFKDPQVQRSIRLVADIGAAVRTTGNAKPAAESSNLPSP